MSDSGHLDDERYPLLERIHEEQAQLCERYLHGDDVLEIGCGKNPIAVEAGCEYVAFDPERNDLAGARTNAPARQYVAGIGDGLPFGSGSFGTVLMRGVVHHLPGDRRQQLFREIHRVLGSGGVLVVVEPDPTSSYRQLVWSVADLLGYEYEQSPYVETDGWVTPSDIEVYTEGAGLSVEVNRGLGTAVAPLAFFYSFYFGADAISRRAECLPVDWWRFVVARRE